MRKLRNFMKVVALSSVVLVASCEKDNTESDVASSDAVSDDLVAKLDGFYLNGKAAVPFVNEYPDGSSQEGVMVEDLFFSTEQIQAMQNLKDGEMEIWGEQYRTTNLVSQPKTISVIGYTGGQFALSSAGRTGLQWAVNNYNRLNLNIRFTLTFAASTSADMVIYDNSVNNPGSSGGSAGFPSGGNPFKFIQIYGLSGSSNNVNEHVICHEMGHSIGFRHTDYFSRQSCGDNVNEGSAGVGAILIPGTPSGFDPNSIMLACFNDGVNGEFNNNDITALNFLY
ncbi:M57 family metalloprotease [Maribacter sp. 2-571]|uniref:M57 family metalloprotease n=1 Tax=Maribacter sp. 2-571 TaxID=3417569 RepID=UPI003D350D64